MTPTELAELWEMSEWILRPSFYVEARVGSQNHRGECCRALMNDARRNERADELLKKFARAFLAANGEGDATRMAATIDIARLVIRREAELFAGRAVTVAEQTERRRLQNDQMSAAPILARAILAGLGLEAKERG